ncbi:hypothetical protein [Botrimarina sp.]|uniref:hypothetical protein n=1 Tax=Botrimarina sp. TaxID=2795802 RepID=UPI0032F02A91
MDAVSSRHAELTTRRLAQWGSVAAAVLFAGAFLTDDKRRLVDPTVIAYTACVVLTFVGYAMAWRPRYEVIGSLLAIAGLVAAFFVAQCYEQWWPHVLMLGAAAPAVLHLTAVGWRRARHARVQRTHGARAVA